MAALVIFGEPGCGKTRNAEALRKAYGKARVIDEWDGCTPLKSYDLALTNVRPADGRYRVVRYQDAIKGISGIAS